MVRVLSLIANHNNKVQTDNRAASRKPCNRPSKKTRAQRNQLPRANTPFYVAFQDDRGGVFANLQVFAIIAGGYLSPFAALAEAIDSSSALSSGVNFTDKALMLLSRFSILVVPGMGQTSSPWWWTHAKANWDGVQPFLVANWATCSNSLLLCSTFSSWNLGILYKCSKHLL